MPHVNGITQIQRATSTCAQKLIEVSLIHRMETKTKKWKTEELKSTNGYRYAQKYWSRESVKSVLIKKKRLRWEGFAASIRQKFFVDRVINVWNALPSTVNFASLNVLATALKRLISPVFSFVIFYLCDRICTQ